MGLLQMFDKFLKTDGILTVPRLDGRSFNQKWFNIQRGCVMAKLRG